MDEHESNTEPGTPNTFEVTRRTVIKTGTTALPMARARTELGDTSFPLLSRLPVRA